MNLKNSQYQAIMRQYDLRQLHHQHLLNLRRQEVMEKIPAFAELDTEIAGIYANQARAAILGNSQPQDQLRQRINDCLSRQLSLLTEAGYPEDYLALTYTCPDCHDTGLIGTQKCHCFKQAMVDLLYSQSNIHDVLKKENFDTFDMNFYSTQKDRRLGISPRENMQSIVTTCKDFIAQFDTHARNLLFYGDTGVGKTFLTNCIARELLDTSHTVIYLTAFHLVDILQTNTFGQDDLDDSGENMFDYILDCDLLIIDDLGTELNNSFVTSQLFLCINERLISRKSTIISTNLSLDELQNEYSERIFSRLVSNYEIMLILGDDIRIKKAISS
jgi:DNA replication protein DnaC